MDTDMLQVVVSQEHTGCRLDNFLQQSWSQYSRTRLQGWIRRGLVLIDGDEARPSALLRAGQVITVQPEPLAPLRAEAENIPLEVLYEDQDLVAINKPAGMVVHSGAGNHSGTLVNALLHRYGVLSSFGGEERPGIVHRIDRGTSGVIIVARNDLAHRGLASQFAARKVGKLYVALVQGETLAEQGTVESPISRDPIRRIRMTTKLRTGRTAMTWWAVSERFAGFTKLDVRIGTGRTHQVRVHMASIGHPVAGDVLYGARPSASGRFFLHARRIDFLQPRTGVSLRIEAPLAPELEQWLSVLRAIPLE